MFNNPEIARQDIPMLKPNNSLPPQPWDYRVPQSPMTVRFNDYSPRLLDLDVAFCMLDAANLVMTHWGDFDPNCSGHQLRVYEIAVSINQRH